VAAAATPPKASVPAPSPAATRNDESGRSMVIGNLRGVGPGRVA
jgi:hypothetical protein